MADIDTWMPWHIADYLADTMNLSTLEHGAYLLILAHGWRNGGKIACSDVQLAKITRMPLDQWKAIRPSIEEFFIATEKSGIQYWHQKRQIEEIQKALAQKEKAVAKAQKMNQARWGKSLQDSLEPPTRILSGIHNDSSQEGKGKDSLNLPKEEKIALVAGGDPSKPTAKEEFWKPLCSIFGLNPRTIADEQRLYQQCLDFRLKGATVPEVERRAGIYQATFPNVAFTPKGLLNNWDNLKEAPKKGVQNGKNQNSGGNFSGYETASQRNLRKLKANLGITSSAEGDPNPIDRVLPVFSQGATGGGAIGN